jgi:NAD(P)-dependent dehydrogenase (short-subunit alcohol dehydrogenase family)
MDLGLSGRVAVVTGASRGIGLAVVAALVAEGVTVVAGARTTSDELAAVARKGDVRVVRVDLSTPDGPAELVAAAGDRIDVLVNNVGAAGVRADGFLGVTDDQWAATLNLNLLAAVRATRAALPVMLAAGRGSIVNVCSVNSILADPAVIDYCAAKAALASFSKALSREVGGRGVRVNTVSPGPVATDLWLGRGGVAATVAQASGRTPEEIEGEAARGSVTGRFTRPDEVADAVLLLAGDRTGNVTGADITVDGGLVPTW